MRTIRLSIAASIFMSVVSASATTYVDTTPLAFAPGEQTSITGTVVSIRAERHRRRILSRVALATATGETIEFLVPGGSIDGVRMRVAGAPHFVVGEHTRVNLRATRLGLQLTELGTSKVVLP